MHFTKTLLKASNLLIPQFHLTFNIIPADKATGDIYEEAVVKPIPFGLAQGKP
jgi:hypothetical protein